MSECIFFGKGAEKNRDSIHQLALQRHLMIQYPPNDISDEIYMKIENNEISIFQNPPQMTQKVAKLEYTVRTLGNMVTRLSERVSEKEVYSEYYPSGGRNRGNYKWRVNIPNEEYFKLGDDANNGDKLIFRKEGRFWISGFVFMYSSVSGREIEGKKNGIKVFRIYSHSNGNSLSPHNEHNGWYGQKFFSCILDVTADDYFQLHSDYDHGNYERQYGSLFFRKLQKNEVSME